MITKKTVFISDKEPKTEFTTETHAKLLELMYDIFEDCNTSIVDDAFIVVQMYEKRAELVALLQEPGTTTTYLERCITNKKALK